MTDENNGEKKLKQCFETIIKIVSDTINEKQAIKDFNLKLKNLLDDCLPSLSSLHRNYLLNILYEYNYDDEEKTLSNSFTKDMLKPFLHDIQGALALLDASQAAFDGNQGIVKQFIGNFPTIKNKSGLYGTTMLYSAARNNHFALVKYLIETAHCSPNVQNEEYLEKDQPPTRKATIGSTPLHAACYHGHLPIVKYLIQHGGDYFILNNAGETPVENAQSKSSVRNFFQDFLLGEYSTELDILPTKSILDEIEQKDEQIIDCVWEYKPLVHDQWFPFQPNPSNQLQETLNDQPLKIDIQIKTARDIYHVSIPQFLRSGKNNDNNPESCAWIRCRGSSLLNFRCYSHWQFMFLKHPTGSTNTSPTLEILDMKTKKIQLNSWYNCDNEMNYTLETAMNYRRKLINLNLSFLNKEKMKFDLEKFTFTNQQETIEGCLRWIPKLISDKTKLTLIDNFQSTIKGDVMLLTISHLKRAQQHGSASSDEIDQYDLKYGEAFENDDLDFENKVVNDADVNGLINVVQGDLTAQNCDVIVISTSSTHLLRNIYVSGGASFQKAYDNTVAKNIKIPVVSLPAEGHAASKVIYFPRWFPDKDHDILCQSIEKLVSDVIEKAANENYKSIAFPPIGCEDNKCPIDLVTQTLIKQVQRVLTEHPMSITFVIQPDSRDVYDEFRKHIGPVAHKALTQTSSLTIGKGLIEIIRGNIIKQKVDVIIGSSSSENLRQILLKAGGDQVERAYDNEYQHNPNSLVIITPPGDLPCQKIFFLKWEPDTDPDVLEQSIIDLIYNLIQNVKSHNFTSIAFPALGCGEHACSVDIVVRTMVSEMKKQFKTRKLAWNVKFVIHPNQQNVFNEFCKQLISSDQESVYNILPSTWENSKEHKLRFIVPKSTEEYKSMVADFEKQVKGKYTEIVKLERIQNERWYMQYKAHYKDFKNRLNEDTEQRLYHGCPGDAATSIIEDCFNRSFAGKNGTKWGVGVYFSSNAVYSTQFARPNSNGERCMFIACVLIGKTTKGDPSMKTRPVGFDSTTDGEHIFVTYHDAQAYAEYLITYK